MAKENVTDDLRAELKRFVTGRLKHDDIRGQVMKGAHPIGIAILRAGLDAHKILGGNVHHGTLSELAKDLGFSVETDARTTNGGKGLEKLKERRNQLAHGNLSFLDIGQETPIDEIMQIKNQVLAYLAGILDNIDDYLSHKGYLADSQPTAKSMESTFQP